MNKGDIVLVPFHFSDLTGHKYRPALILIESENDVTVCFITTQFKWESKYDISVEPSELNGLKKPSIIKLNKLATLDKELVTGLLGIREKNYIDILNRNLISLLKLKES